MSFFVYLQTLICMLSFFFASPLLAQQRYVKWGNEGLALEEDAPQWFMVLDTETELVWEIKSLDDSIHNKDREFSFNEIDAVFLKTLNEQSYGGFNDWRLPTDVELKSLYQRRETAPHIDTGFFPNTEPAYYWSYYICGDGTYTKEKINFGEEKIRSKTYRVRAVRAGKQ